MTRRKLPIIFLSEINSRKGDVNAFIAAYILEHLEEIQNDSIRELAAKINTSPSAISRFCRETGIGDYNELKDMIRSTALSYETGSCAGTPEQRRDEYLAAVEESLELLRVEVPTRVRLTLADHTRLRTPITTRPTRS